MKANFSENIQHVTAILKLIIKSEMFSKAGDTLGDFIRRSRRSAYKIADI